SDALAVVRKLFWKQSILAHPSWQPLAEKNPSTGAIVAARTALLRPPTQKMAKVEVLKTSDKRLVHVGDFFIGYGTDVSSALKADLSGRTVLLNGL
ncbi:MAG: hypothetical protein RMI90_11810, partial [Thermoguttaceae bacterium]|nr:hypothetical protein [Thermoguttaceae bacterium]